ncbi:hypothetical protein PTI98_006135 [Pleurotus ostreatus]|nr:hypothetical protein PTI98_006135 [Pleurotus ostreatus]
MSLKAELETWAAALKAYDEQDFEKSLDMFSRIADSSKILTNMGLIYATLGEHETAVERFMEATTLDQYLAVAYFQCGVSNFLLARYELAYKDFDEALLYLRGNQAINYEQLGLKFRLFSAEVLFNKGLSQIYMNRVQEGLEELEAARKEKATEEHDVIDDALRDRGEGYTVFSIPVGVLYRPSEKKLKNSVAKDYLGKAKLVAASDPGDAYTEFTGVARLKQGISPSGVFIDGEGSGLGRSGTLGRSATVPAALPSNSPLPDREPLLNRSRTALPSSNREPNPNDPRPSPGGLSPGGANVQRSNTSIVAGRPSPNATIGGPPTRGLSIRKPVGSPPVPQDRTPPAPPKDSRVTQFYDEYLDSYGDDAVPPPMPSAGAAPPERVAAWARSNANPGYASGVARSGSRSAPTSNYAGSSLGVGGTMKRKLTRRGTSRAGSRSQVGSMYEEEEEGYASGDYEDGPFELTKIRVKLHYEEDVHGMVIVPEMSFDEFMAKVASKFRKPVGSMGLKFKDEDAVKVNLRDDSDYELAIETARESSKGKPEGKLEIWCIDV